MSELLPVIDFVPSNANDSKAVRSPIPPYVPGRPSTSSRVIVDADLFPASSIRASLDLEDGVRLKDGRIFAIIAVLTGVQFLSSLSNGFLTVGLPRMASDLSLPEHLLLWPSGVY